MDIFPLLLRSLPVNGLLGTSQNLLTAHPFASLLAGVQSTTTAAPSATPIPVTPGQPEEMIGIILAGVILVIIVLGGTIGATRHRKV